MQTEKKIVYLLDRYEHPYGGTERQILELIRNLDRRRFQPSVAVFRDSDYLRQHEFDCPVDVLDINRIARFETARHLYSYSRALRAKDFVISQIFFNDASIVAPPFLKLAGLRVIVSRRDMGFWYTKSNKTLLRLSGMFVDHVIANSEAVKKSVQTNEGFADSKISVVYNGYSATRARSVHRRNVRYELGIDDDAMIVGIVANLRAVKRIDDLVRAFALVSGAYPKAQLVIVGTGSLRASLENLALSLNIRSRVTFTGQIADVLPVVQEFHLGVLCSDSEGFSNSIIEYMKCGKPTVCTDVGGNIEIVKEGYNGFLVQVGDIDALADRIGTLLANQELAARLGRNALSQVNEQYDVPGMVDAHMSLYDRLVAKST